MTEITWLELDYAANLIAYAIAGAFTVLAFISMVRS